MNVEGVGEVFVELDTGAFTPNISVRFDPQIKAVGECTLHLKFQRGGLDTPTSLQPFKGFTEETIKTEVHRLVNELREVLSE